MSGDTKTQHGYLLLADISGYTSFLAGTELDHAHEILTDLLETVVDGLKPVLMLSKLEGDAVFAYAPARRLPRGETLLELVEATYGAFRERVEVVHRRTTCECDACRAAPTLDLKILAHYGQFIVQRVSGYDELLGSDVNLIHRLLKNHVGDATGWRAYALFTERALSQMNLAPEGMHAQPEAYEHLGEVTTFSLDLRQQYEALRDSRRVYVAPETAHQVLTVDCPAPPPVVWAWLNEPAKRLQWENEEIRPVWRPHGRTAAGARNHCVHGKSVTMIETVLDWRPFEYFTVSKATQVVPLTHVVTFALQPLAGGAKTRLSININLEMPLPKAWLKPVCHWLSAVLKLEQAFHRLAQHMAAAAAGE